MPILPPSASVTNPSALLRSSTFFHAFIRRLFGALQKSCVSYFFHVRSWQCHSSARSYGDTSEGSACHLPQVSHSTDITSLFFDVSLPPLHSKELMKRAYQSHVSEHTHRPLGPLFPLGFFLTIRANTNNITKRLNTKHACVTSDLSQK